MFVLYILSIYLNITELHKYLLYIHSFLPGLSSLLILFYCYFYEFKFSKMPLFYDSNVAYLSVLCLSTSFYNFLSSFICWIMLLKMNNKRLYLPLIIIYELIGFLALIIFITKFTYYYYLIVFLPFFNCLLWLLIHLISNSNTFDNKNNKKLKFSRLSMQS